MTADCVLAALSDTANSPVTIDMTIDAAGLDSLDLVDVVMKLEETHHVEIPDEATEAKTVEEFTHRVMTGAAAK